MAEKRKLDVLVMCINTSMHTVTGQVINMVISPVRTLAFLALTKTDERLNEYKKALYIERSDLDYVELNSNEENKRVMDTLLRLDVLEDETKSELFTVYKAHDHQISERINSYIKGLCKICKDNGYELRFWTTNPLDWSFFLNTGFYFINGEPQLYEGMDPYPIELNSYIKSLPYTDEADFEIADYFNKTLTEELLQKNLLLQSAAISSVIIMASDLM